jgi:hypothetical protein
MESHEHAWQEIVEGKRAVPVTLTIVEVRGRDAGKVLNNLCTAAVAQLADGTGCEAFITDVRGKTLGHGFIHAIGERFLICGAPGQAAAICAHVDRYTIREDAVATDTGEAMFGWLLSGCAPIPAWSAFCPWTTSGRGTEQELRNAVLCEDPCNLACEVRITSPSDLLVIAPRERIEEVRRWASDHGLALPHCSAATASENKVLEAIRILQGFPWWGHDFDATALPQELNRDALAISFTKGCYLGQETVARLDALGQVQKRLCGFQSPSGVDLLAGKELAQLDGKIVGKVTSLAPTPSGSVGLGMIRRGNWEPGTQLRCGDAMITVCPLPIPLPRIA